MKKLIAIIVAMMCALGSLSLVGCGAKDGDENTLQIWIKEAGYGVEWVMEATQVFSQQDWVKEKYPQLVIDQIDTDGDADGGLNYLVGGATHYDLVMPTAGLTSGTFLENYKMFEDLTGLYGTQIPGEDITLGEKMIDNVYDDQAIFLKDEDNKEVRYSIPWITGAHGWFYNETTYNKYLAGTEWATALPRTTNEFVEMLDALLAGIKAKGEEGKNYPIYHHRSAVSYWTSDALTWWAQYEGVDGYNAYFNGTNAEGEIDVTAAAENTKQTGRLRALEALDSIINYSNKYVDQDWIGEIGSYTATLGKLRNGTKCVFSSNGDWIENETTIYETEGHTIRMMRTPVISSIVEKLSFSDAVDPDAILSEMIRRIDIGDSYKETKTACIQLGSDITEEDFDAVKEARNIVSRVGGHGMYIPNYAKAKELAKDFLLFLASDAGIEVCMKNRVYTCYDYDSSKVDVSGLSQMRKDFIEIMDDAREQGTLLRNTESFPLVYYGKFGPFSSNLNPHIGALFLQNSANSRKSPQEVFESCQKLDGAMSSMMAMAGIISNN